MTREDSVKTKNSAPECEKVRRITKNCKDKLHKSSKESKYNQSYSIISHEISPLKAFLFFLQAVCVFEKPKSVPWSECKVG